MPINPTTQGGELQFPKECGLCPFLPAGSPPSRIRCSQNGEYPHASKNVRTEGKWCPLRKERETGPSLLNNYLAFVVKTVTCPSTSQTQCCLTSVISRDQVCGRGWGAAPRALQVSSPGVALLGRKEDGKRSCSWVNLNLFFFYFWSRFSEGKTREKAFSCRLP